jgi:hypothetical protein
MYNVAGHVLDLSLVGSSPLGWFGEGGSLMKQCYLVILFISLGSLAFSQNKNVQAPGLRPYHANANKPVAKGVIPHTTSGDLTAHHKPIGNAGQAPVKNGTNAEVATLEHQQATVHNPKPAPKNGAPAAAAKAKKPIDTNQPIDFAYKAPNVKNTPVGGQANGRATH